MVCALGGVGLFVALGWFRLRTVLSDFGISDHDNQGGLFANSTDAMASIRHAIPVRRRGYGIRRINGRQIRTRNRRIVPRLSGDFSGKRQSYRAPPEGKETTRRDGRNQP